MTFRMVVLGLCLMVCPIGCAVEFKMKREYKQKQLTQPQKVILVDTQ